MEGTSRRHNTFIYVFVPHILVFCLDSSVVPILTLDNVLEHSTVYELEEGAGFESFDHTEAEPSRAGYLMDESGRQYILDNVRFSYSS